MEPPVDPGGCPGFPYQDHPVRILASNDPALDALGRDGVRLVPFELERHLRSHPGTTATYATTDALGEKVVTAGPVTDAAPLTRRFLDKFVKIQPVPPPEHGAVDAAQGVAVFQADAPPESRAWKDCS